MNLVGVIGMLAGVLTTGAAIPQVIKTYRTRHARDLSMWQLVMLIAGMFLWLVYGLCISDLPLILANSISILCYSSLIVMKLRFAQAGLDRPAPAAVEDPEPNG
ncbi:SemiSWEET family sugar transporter [Geomesophilobacter sediminis]|uniref:SemiSWEET transporter n=1 Tax=Geomesophilobacter sediminis TaxID=2798584 RepID=A0A8J7S733_9BACT|nr:SemiSWEET transporter [Geomesophilobacter sediminis]MBJ6726791.1 SemiSWEET transporter [Geomesophilobacter sediminis]